MKPFATLRRLLACDPAAVLVTVVGARGSTPREAGARMVVSASGAIAGTIGGGRLELDAIETARALAGEGRDTTAIRRFALGPALGQCCGGHVTLALEVFTQTRAGEIGALADAEAAGPFVTEAVLREGEPLTRVLVGSASGAPAAMLDGDRLLEVFGRRDRTVYLFGAGHVGRAVVLALAPLPFEVVWVDERRDMFPAAVPGSVRLVVTDRPADVAAGAAPGAFALIMTHDHGVDLEILHSVLAHGGYGYAGLIGSDTKRARFESRLRQLGLDDEAAKSFRCPIGVPGIHSKEPAMIATAVAAELLIEDERLGARRGKPAAPLITAVQGAR